MNKKHENSLDPEDWDKARELAHQAVDDAIDWLTTLRDRPTWQPIPEEVIQHFDHEMPRQGEDLGTIYQDYLDDIRAYPMGNVHPRFWAWYMGNGSFQGALADFLANIMNSNLGGANHSAVYVEQQVTRWLCEAMKFPSNASGLLVSGGSMANMVGLAVARHVHANEELRQKGIYGEEKRMMFYASTEVHSCHQKSLELMGLGSDSLSKIPVNSDFEIDVEALTRQIESDRTKGLKPVCVIASAGTINTGSVDDMSALADLCERENLWFHVDGAIGAVAMVSPQIEKSLKGLERADSLAMDLHKWMHIPFEAGCVLVRDQQQQLDTFSLTPAYLQKALRGIASTPVWFADLGLQLSRQFRALKIWFSIREHGMDKFARLMERNVEQANYVAEKVRAEPKLQLMAPVKLNIVCLRYVAEGVDDETLNAWNHEILLRIQERGIAVPSDTLLDGIRCLRLAISNYRTTLEDLDFFLTEMLKIGEELR